MYSVTQRVRTIKQPYGGYIKPSSFEKISLEDGLELNDNENIHSALVGLTVDYLTRFQMGTTKENAFQISLRGAEIVNQRSKALKLLNGIVDLDDNSITNACKLTGYDVCLRANAAAYKPIEDINPNSETINNIRIMVKRSLVFFKKYGPVLQDGITFSGGYTRLVSSGDADFITEDTLWDFKVSKNRITSQHTLQLLMYYLMGSHSNNEYFKQITKLGIFNPRMNTVYIKEIGSVSKEVFTLVENEVIGYNGNDSKIIEGLLMTKTNRNLNQEQDISNEITQDFFTIADLMQMMQCSRHMIMKMYSEQGLPLEKVGSRYQISKESLEQWVALKNKKIELENERQKKTRRIVIISCLVGITIIVALFVFLSIYFR